jgi:hypothetical protein
VTGEVTTARKTGTTFERSAFLAKDLAERFCSAMLARPDIITAEVCRDHHLTGDVPKWYVRWIRGMAQTAEDAPVEDANLLDDRAIRAACQANEFEFLPMPDNKQGVYCIHTYPDSDGMQAVYGVTRHYCTCQDWQYRCQSRGIKCKHQLAYISAFFPPVQPATRPTLRPAGETPAERRERLLKNIDRDF